MYFITGNSGKFAEAVSFFPKLEQIKMDLPEIQELDPQAIIAAKVEVARRSGVDDFLVEDTSLYFEGMNGLPGPLVKWFVHALKPEGLFKLAQSFNVKKAEARTVIGWAKHGQKVVFAEGSTTGTLVSPRGKLGFGWDGIFVPDGEVHTYAEMPHEHKITLSHRTKALKKLLELQAK